MKMKEQLSSKQQERNEKKKKKLAALANLIQMNDRDRIHEAELAKRRDHDEQEDDGFITVSKRKPRNRLTIMADSSSDTTVPAAPAAVYGGESGESDEPEIKRSRNHSAGGDNILDNINTTLTQEQYKSLSTELRRRKRELESVPAVHLREMGRRALLEIPQQERTPIFLTDIQHLLMSALIGKKSPCVPDRWCSADKFQSLSHSVVLILEGLSLYHYLSNESRFEATNRIFDTKLEMVLPPQDEGKIIDTIAQVTLSILICVSNQSLPFCALDSADQCASTEANQRARFAGIGCGTKQGSDVVRKDNISYRETGAAHGDGYYWFASR